MSSTSPSQFSLLYPIFFASPSPSNSFALLFVYTLLIYLFVTLSHILLFNIQNFNIPPGPWYTYFTNIVLRYHEWNGNRRLYIHELHGKYGDAVRIGVRQFSFCGREGVRGVYGAGIEGGRGERGQELDKTGFYGLFRQLGVRTTFSTEARVEHKEKKRHIAKPYRNSEILKSSIVQGVEERSRAFLQNIQDSKDGIVDAYRYTHCYALDCASHFLIGKRGTKSIEGKTGMEIMEEMTYHSSLKNQLLAFYLQPLSTFLLSLFPRRSSPLTNAYILSSCLIPNPQPHTLLYALQNTSPHLSKTDIAAEVLDHLAAGIDTTGAALTFLMYTLSLPRNFEIQEKLYRSLKETQSANLKSDTNTRTYLYDATYLNAIIQETLRLYPPIPMSQPRLTKKNKPRIIDGYTIPGNSIVSVQAWSLHRNTKNFNDADTFCPERWLVNHDELREMEKGFLAFGRGGRACTGKHLAQLEMWHLIQKVYAKYRTRIKYGWEIEGEKNMEMEDQIIASRPKGQMCWLAFERRT